MRRLSVDAVQHIGALYEGNGTYDIAHDHKDEKYDLLKDREGAQVDRSQPSHGQR